MSPAERLGVLATLPPEGEVQDLNTSQRKKLAVAWRVLLLLRTRGGVRRQGHRRSSGRRGSARSCGGAGLEAGARSPRPRGASSSRRARGRTRVLLEPVFPGRARRDDDRSLLQTLELLCDGLAIVTLRRDGMDPGRLTSALDRVSRYNRDRFGAALNEDDYPAIGERRRFARRLLEWLGRPEPHDKVAAGRDGTKRSCCRGNEETRRMAPQVGFEPTTLRLTAGRLPRGVHASTWHPGRRPPGTYWWRRRAEGLDLLRPASPGGLRAGHSRQRGTLRRGASQPISAQARSRSARGAPRHSSSSRPSASGTSVRSVASRR